MEQQFIGMLNKHRGIIYKVCNLYCDDTEDRRDLFQEIVLQLWRSFPSFRNDSSPSTWMYRIGLNTAITNFRKDSKRPERIAISERELQIPDMTYLSEKSENINLLKQAMECLNHIEKAIMMLYLEEKSYEEISEIVGISRSNVGVKINRIKTKLETIIKTQML